MQPSFLVKRFAYVSAFLALAYVLGFFFFVYFLPKSEDIPIAGQNSLVVVITGGKDRLKYGIELAQNFGSALLLSGVNANSAFEDILDYNGLQPPNIREIFVGRAAKNTPENALEAEICSYINNFDSIVLVTSNYHLLRSKQIFSHLISIPIYATSVNNFKISMCAIFTDREKFSLLLKEYSKYVLWLGSLLLEKYFALFNLK